MICTQLRIAFSYNSLQLAGYVLACQATVRRLIFLITPDAVKKAGFDILEPGPAGGTASIYKVRHIPTGQLCALKISHSDAGAEAMAHEASLIEKLNHPSIIRFFAQGFIDSSAYLATHWITGNRLSEVIRRSSPIHADRAIELYHQIASALQHAHDKGVVHADISTANIIVDSNDKVTLLDFGIGQQTDLATITANSDFTGTLRYVAPEIIQGERPSAQSDQYAIALILYEMLTGCWPYEGETTAASALHNHLYSEPVSVQEHNPALSNAIDQALLTSLSKDPSHRFSNVSAMTIALDSVSPDNSGREPSASSGSILLSPLSLRRFAFVAAFIGLISGVIWQQRSSVAPDRELNFAETLVGQYNTQCNLLKAPAIGDDGVVTNFYGTDDLADRISLSVTDENDWQLTIGKSNQYGLYGQIVEVQPDLQYQLSAIIQREGYLHMPALRIEWLDAEFQIQPELLIEYGIESLDDGVITMPAVQVPENAFYAVPTLYKDETEGTMKVTSLMFNSLDCN